MSDRMRQPKPCILHCLADCLTCGQHWEDFLTAHRLAKRHASRTGHKVSVEIGMAVTYCLEVRDA